MVSLRGPGVPPLGQDRRGVPRVDVGWHDAQPTRQVSRLPGRRAAETLHSGLCITGAPQCSGESKRERAVRPCLLGTKRHRHIALGQEGENRMISPQDPRVRQDRNRQLELSISLATGEEERRRVARALATAPPWAEINRLTAEAARLRADVARLRGCLAEAIALVAELRGARKGPGLAVAGKARRASA